MGRDPEADEAARREEEERRARMADPLLAALPEGLQKRQQVRVLVGWCWTLLRALLGRRGRAGAAVRSAETA